MCVEVWAVGPAQVGFEPQHLVHQRTVDCVAQLPPNVLENIPMNVAVPFELEIYLADLSLAQAYYFRHWETRWIDTCFGHPSTLTQDHSP